MTDTTAPSPAPQPAPQPAPPPPAAAPVEPPRKRVLISVLLIAIAVAGVLLVLWAWRLPPFTSGVQHTDNAYVRGQVTVIAPQVTGYVTSVEVQDFQTVKQGQLLATVDDRIYRQRLEQAQAQLHAAEAALANSTQSQNSARGSVAQSNASIAAARANVAKAQADHNRARTLFEGGWVAQAQVDVTRTALQAAQAQLAAAQAATASPKPASPRPSSARARWRRRSRTLAPPYIWPKSTFPTPASSRRATVVWARSPCVRASRSPSAPS